MSITDDPTLLDTPLENLTVPVTKHGVTTDRKLKPTQRQFIRRAESINHPVFRRRVENAQEGQPQTIGSNSGVIISSMGTGKTVSAFIVGINEWQRSGKPVFYSADLVNIIQEAEEQFVELFTNKVGRAPVIHRYGENGHIDEGEPDIVMASPQLISTFSTFEGRDHEILEREYGLGVFDEGDRFATSKRSEIVNNKLKCNKKIIMSGTIARRDDPEEGYRVLDEFGPLLYRYGFEDSIANGDVNKPDYVLYATNIFPLLHHILNGKVKINELNDVYTSHELNLEYLRVFEENYQELEQPQTIFYCKTKEHAIQMEELMRAQGYDPLPIHTGVTPEQRKQNRKEFKARPNGGIAIAVDMMRRGENYHDLGLIVETAETKSESRFFQTLGRAVRGKNVRFVDVTTSFKQIQHVRLFAQRLETAYRRAKREQYESNKVDMTGVEIHPSVDKFLRDMIKSGIVDEGTTLDNQITLDDIIERSGLKREFFFSLRAHACSVWLERNELDRRKSSVKLRTGAEIRLENGLLVTLQEPENVDVRRWIKELKKKPDGSFDLSPEQKTLVDSLEIDLDEVEQFFTTPTRPENKPTKTGNAKKSASRIKAKEYFESDDFWLGLETMHRMFEQLDMTDFLIGQTLFDKSYSGITQAPKRFLTENEELRADETYANTDQPVDMKQWKKNVIKYFDRAPKEVQAGLIGQGVIFDRTLAYEILLRSHIDTDLDANKTIKGLGHSPKLNWEVKATKEWETEGQSSYRTVKAGSEIMGPDQKPIKILFDHMFPYQDFLRTQSSEPSLDWLYFKGWRNVPSPAKIDQEILASNASTFIKSDYYWLCAHAKLHFSSDTDALGRVTIPAGTEIYKWTDSSKPKAPTIVLAHDVQIDMKRFYRDLEPHIPYLNKDIARLVTVLFPELESVLDRASSAIEVHNENGIPKVIKQAGRHQVETDLFQTWLSHNPENLAVSTFPPEVQITAPNVSDISGLIDALNRCRFLAYRYIEIEYFKSNNKERYGYSYDRDAVNLREMLEEFGWETDLIKDEIYRPRRIRRISRRQLS